MLIRRDRHIRRTMKISNESRDKTRGKDVPNGKEIFPVRSMCAHAYACTVHPPPRWIRVLHACKMTTRVGPFDLSHSSPRGGEKV